MKKLIILATSVLFLSCQSKQEKIEESYRFKRMQLEYLRSLYSIKQDISLEEKKKTIDSLIIAEELNLEL